MTVHLGRRKAEMTRQAITFLCAAALAVAAPVAVAGGRPAGIKKPDPRTPVLYFGDSIARESQPFFTEAIERSHRARVVATTFRGIAPCDQYRAMSAASARYPRSPVVVSYFGNVLTPCAKAGFKAWAQRAQGDSLANLYREQLQQTVRYFPQGLHIWVAISPTARASDPRDSSGLTRRAKFLKIANELASSDPRVSVVDAGASVNAPDGRFALNLPCLADEPCTNDGRPGYTQVRSADGLHLCPGAHANGYLRCSRYAAGAVRYGHALAAPVTTLLGL